MNDGRIMPQSLESEQATLGAMLMEPRAVAEAMDIISGEMFWRELHRTIFTAISTLATKNSSADLFAVTEELRRKNQLEDVGGAGYLTALIEACSSAANITNYAKVVKETFIQRELLKASEKIAADVYGKEFSISELLDNSEQRVLDVSRHQLTAEPDVLADLVQAQRVRLVEAVRNPHGNKGITSGIPLLDKMTGGWKSDQLITIAAASSMGKSALASQLAYTALKATKRPVIIFSLEMSKEQWVDRMLSSVAGVNGFQLRNGSLSEEEWLRVDKVQDEFAALPMHIVDIPALTTREIKAQVRRIAMLHGQPALICVDYLQIAEPGERIKEERLRVTQMVRDFKNLARQIKSPVLCLSQISRAVSQRENKRPTLSDLRETSAIEAESDVVVFIYRPSYYKAKEQTVNKWQQEAEEENDEIIVGKQRNGPTGIVPVRFVPEYTRFENLALGYGQGN